MGTGHLALAILVLAAPAAAQTPQTAPPAPTLPAVTIDEAVQRALERNPTIAAAATNIARAEQLLAQSRSTTRPTLSAGFTNLTIDSSRSFVTGGQRVITQPMDQVTFSATASVPLFVPTRWSGVSQAGDQVTVAQRSTAETRRQIAVSTAEAYLTVIASHRQIDVDQRSLEVARAHLEYAQKRLEGGAGSRLNQLRAAQEVSTDEATLEQARLALLRSQEALGVLMGENTPVDASAEPAFDLPANVSEADWMAARTDVQFQQSVISAAQRVVRDSARDWWPTATATFTPQYITPASIFQISRSWSLNVSFSQPIYTGGVQRAVAAQREVALQQAQIELTTTQIQARSEVRVAQSALASLERALTSSRLAATQAEDVLRITTAAFEVGATTNLEVIDAQRSARDAETAATIAEDAVRRARLDLLVALGRFPK